jgi:hypothetical protein
MIEINSTIVLTWIKKIYGLAGIINMAVIVTGGRLNHILTHISICSGSENAINS